MVFMAWGGIAGILNQWESIGVFAYVLPFLLIFAVIFGILSATNILGHNRGVHAIVALVVGLMALQFNMVTVFFGELFPRLAVGLAVLLVVLILFGLFVPSRDIRYWYWGFAVVSFIIAVIVISRAFNGVGWGYTYYMDNDFVGYVIGAILLLGVIIAVVASGRSESHGGGSAEFTIHRKGE